MTEPVLTTRLAEGPGDMALLQGLEDTLQTRAEPDFIARLIQSGRSVVLGFLDGRAAGYAVVNWTPEYSLFARLEIPELQDLNVLPGDRGCGLGRAIVLACEDLARGRGHDRMGLGVGLTRSYGSAQRLYVRMGYVPDGYGITRDRQAVGPGDMVPVDDDVCLMMIKDLDGKD